MNSLENQILKLSKIAVVNNDYKEVEKELQIIGRMLVTDYIIKIGNTEEVLLAYMNKK